jgi:hypothetical protein
MTLQVSRYLPIARSLAGKIVRAAETFVPGCGCMISPTYGPRRLLRLLWIVGVKDLTGLAHRIRALVRERARDTAAETWWPSDITRYSTRSLRPSACLAESRVSGQKPGWAA